MPEEVQELPEVEVEVEAEAEVGVEGTREEASAIPLVAGPASGDNKKGIQGTAEEACTSVAAVELRANKADFHTWGHYTDDSGLPDFLPAKAEGVSVASP